MKSRDGKGQREEKERVEERKVRRENSRRKKMQVWLRRSKSRLAKAAGAEPAGHMRDEKLHAAVAQSTCRSQNVQNTPFLAAV